MKKNTLYILILDKNCQHLGNTFQLEGFCHRAQLSAPKKWTVGPRTVGPRGPTVRGPTVRGPTVRGPTVRGPIRLEPFDLPRKKLENSNFMGAALLCANISQIFFLNWIIKNICCCLSKNLFNWSLHFFTSFNKPAGMPTDSFENVFYN